MQLSFPYAPFWRDTANVLEGRGVAEEPALRAGRGHRPRVLGAAFLMFIGMEACFMDGDPLIEAKGLAKKYRRGKLDVWALRDATLAVRKGEFVSIIGPSGSGKSTLMHLLACLERPTSGVYTLRG